METCNLDLQTHHTWTEENRSLRQTLWNLELSYFGKVALEVANYMAFAINNLTSINSFHRIHAFIDLIKTYLVLDFLCVAGLMKGASIQKTRRAS